MAASALESLPGGSAEECGYLFFPGADPFPRLKSFERSLVPFFFAGAASPSSVVKLGESLITDEVSGCGLRFQMGWQYAGHSPAWHGGPHWDRIVDATNMENMAITTVNTTFKETLVVLDVELDAGAVMAIYKQRRLG